MTAAVAIDLGRGASVRLHLEGHRRGGSVKDRLVSHLVDGARAAGRLSPGQPIVEVSTGSTALALARWCRPAGHAFEAILPDDVDPEVVAAIESEGAAVRLLPAAEGPPPAVARAARREAEGWWWPRQFEVDGRPAYAGLAAEILAADPGRLEVVVAGVGTGGTIGGLADALRPARPDLRLVGVVASGDDRIDGLRSEGSPRPPWLTGGPIEVVPVGRALARAERAGLIGHGLAAGPSTGAVLAVARALAATGLRRLAAVSADGRRLLPSPCNPENHR